MKIISYTHNLDTDRIMLEVEIEGKSVVITFSINEYNFGVTTTGTYINILTGTGGGGGGSGKPIPPRDILTENLSRAKRELGSYLAEIIFKEYEVLKKLKQ